MLLTQEILEEIFYEMLLRKKYCGFAVYLQIKSLTKILTKIRSSTSLLGRGLLWIASEMLEI